MKLFLVVIFLCFHSDRALGRDECNCTASEADIFGSCASPLCPVDKPVCDTWDNTCTEDCKENEWRCKWFECLPKSFRCDGDYDCGDNSDEDDCRCESNPCQNGGTCKKGECMCKDNTSGPRCENLREKCANGDAKLDADGIPFLFWDGNWSPICGHWFWDDQHGVEAFCQKLGLKGGMFRKKNIPYKHDAIQVGKCRSGETIDSCTAAQNPYTKTGWCQAGYLYDGKHIGFTISCDGHTAGSETQSCYDLCKAKDSDACLKASGKNWGSYACSSSTKWCTSWAKDMKRCCPYACGVTGSFSESDCNDVGGKGSCIYPNEAQPDETQCNEGSTTETSTTETTSDNDAEFSLEALVGKWHHNRGATVTCTRISNTQVNCQLVGSINGLREIIWDGSKYKYAGAVMDAPTIKLNSFGDREIDWDNGNKWSEFEEESKDDCLKYDGILHVRKAVCCNKKCPKCGGVGGNCGQLTDEEGKILGSSQCCGIQIEKSGITCGLDGSKAPCKLPAL